MAEFEIVIGANSMDSRVIVNGVDVTAAIRSVRIDQEAGGLPYVNLKVVGTSGLVRLRAAIDVDKQLGIELPTAENTPLGAEYETHTVLP